MLPKVPAKNIYTDGGASVKCVVLRLKPPQFAGSMFFALHMSGTDKMLPACPVCVEEVNAALQFHARHKASDAVFNRLWQLLWVMRFFMAVLYQNGISIPGRWPNNPRYAD